MKKFFTALFICLIICAGSKIEAAELTQEQFDQMFSITTQNSTENKALTLDVPTFQKNFNDFMTKFIQESNAGDDKPTLEEIFLLKEPLIVQTDAGNFLAKNFMNHVAIVGSVDPNGNLNTLNFFSAKPENKNDMVITVLIFQAFTQGISPQINIQELLGDLEKNQSTTKNGIKFSVTKQGTMEIITAAAE